MSYDGSINVYLDTPHGKAYIEWEFPNVVETKNIISPPFYFLNYKWGFEFVLQDLSNESILIFLRAEFPVFHHSATFKVGLGNIWHTFTCEPFIKIDGFSTRRWRASYAFNYEEFIKRNVNRTMTLLKCYATTDFTPVADTACQTTSLYGTFISCGDFGDLLKDEQNADVRIQVSGQEFKAHKLILQTRSPVFAAMFGHDMAETTKGIVKIDDCDPDIFQHFLQCMYTGRLENVLPENFTRLYEVADKYDVKNLKETCAIFMEECLSIETACDVLVVSDRHNDMNLKKSAEQFLVQNIEAVLPLDKWESLMVDHLVLATQILLKVVQNGIKSKAK